MIFSTPTTPTRERLTLVVGAAACASRLGADTVSIESVIDPSMPGRHAWSETARIVGRISEPAVRILPTALGSVLSWGGAPGSPGSTGRRREGVGVDSPGRPGR